jgi:hypothetical protein
MLKVLIVVVYLHLHLGRHYGLLLNKVTLYIGANWGGEAFPIILYLRLTTLDHHHKDEKDDLSSWQSIFMLCI